MALLCPWVCAFVFKFVASVSDDRTEIKSTAQRRLGNSLQRIMGYSSKQSTPPQQKLSWKNYLTWEVNGLARNPDGGILNLSYMHVRPRELHLSMFPSLQSISFQKIALRVQI